MSEPMHILWTARLIDPLRNAPVGDGSGRTPDEAYGRLVANLRWKANREHEEAGRIEAALETALQSEPLASARFSPSL